VVKVLPILSGPLIYILVLLDSDRDRLLYYKSTLNPSPFSIIKSLKNRELLNTRFI
jgi:hypothetical protein